MERILIIPDIHYRLSVVNIILEREYAQAKRVVFLGDYFDTQDHSHELTAVMCYWLKGVLSDPKCICLLGNHDMHYLYPENHHLLASGYNPVSARVIRQILKPADIKKFHLFTLYKNWLMTHAGLHPGLLNRKNASLRTHLKALCGQAIRAAHAGEPHALLEAGVARRGQALYGGLTWLDFEEEFIPISGINQIVGHTRDSRVRSKNLPKSKNYCIDAKGKYYAILTDESLQIKEAMSGKVLKKKEIKILKNIPRLAQD